MGKNSRMLTVLITAVLMAVGSQPVLAGLYPGIWSATPTILDPSGSLSGETPFPGTRAKDITGVWYATDGSTNYFRMDVIGPITPTDYANVYGIFIGSTKDEFKHFSASDLGTSSAATMVFGIGKILIEVPYGTGTITDSDVTFSHTGNTLEWSVPFGALPGTFYFLGATLSSGVGGGIVADQTDVASTSTPIPIPSAVWLLGSGIIGLVGLKRRQSKRR